LTSYSNFLKAARKSEWLADSAAPVDLSDEKPEIFSRYLNCVYFGAQALQPDANAPEDDRIADPPNDPSSLGPDAFGASLEEYKAQWHEEYYDNGDYSKYVDEHFQMLVELYLLTDRLQDVKTANVVIDEIVRFSCQEMENPGDRVIHLVYEATVHGNPLRKWVRDTQTYDTSSKDHILLHVGEYPAELIRDLAVELMRIRDSDKFVSKLLWRCKSELLDRCRYHLHDLEHPRCVPEQTE
jgi:hypothetical protein